MGHQDVDVRGDRLPLLMELSALDVKSPVVELRRPGTSIKANPLNDHGTILEIAGSGKRLDDSRHPFGILLESALVITGDEDLVTVRLLLEPPEEILDLPRPTVKAEVPRVDQNVPIRHFQAVVIGMRIGNADESHLALVTWLNMPSLTG